MIDMKHTRYHPQKRRPKSHVKGYAIAFVVMLATIYAIVYFGEFIDNL